MTQFSPVRHLYTHVPFCPTICPYCDFHVLLRRAGLVEAYLARLETDAIALAHQYATELDTVYVGGGTPSFLRESEMAKLVRVIRTHLGWGSQENTLEVNPGTVTLERAQFWRELGFDRASVGVQSLNDQTLQFLGRRHSAKQARKAVQTLLEAGFRVSADLITAVPQQDIAADVSGLLALGVSHISAYTLTIEPNTEFARRGVTVHEDDEHVGFTLVAELLEAAGFERYEISNYARPGAESRHNLAYWHNREYLGLGPGAAGHYPVASASALTMRRTNPHLHPWLAGETGQTDYQTPSDFVTDALFMGLRLRQGVDLQALTQRSGLDVAQRYGEVIQRQCQRGLLVQEGQWLRATAAGWWVLNQVVAEFLAVE